MNEKQQTPVTTVRDWGKEAGVPLKFVSGGVHILSHSLTAYLPWPKRSR